MPALIGYAGSTGHLGTAIGGFAVASYAVVLLVTITLPETREKELPNYA